ncbi:MAG: CoA pyrophosphatase [Actinomycetota bacterium]|jgi:8-oxo-dGTP pyrophosphatase MutT (NUDIX family)|nr:CoA pyrophosphatase [Actinomycetota bacterium]|tara:strand:+ start:3545 stop:4234 length:690 start_codon:yes stop_codon:yes gene_type:complete
MNKEEMLNNRGGPQIIPRPEKWWIGDPSPWSNAVDKKLTLEQVIQAVEKHTPNSIEKEDLEEYTQEAGVLVALYEENNSVYVVLTRRSPHLSTHAHQVSFPGGHQEEKDSDLWDTALREAYEETKLDSSLPKMIGELDPIVTVGSGTLIHPFVALLPNRPELTANSDEVEAIRHVDLAELLEEETWREEYWERNGQSQAITFFEIPDETIWGATANILRQLLTLGLGIV